MSSELYEAFEANPTDHKAFEALVKSLIEANDLDGLEALYDRLPEWAPEGDTSRIFQVLAQQARINKESDVGTFLHFHNGLALWQKYDDAKKAEMMFRKMKGDPPDTELLKEFYIQFYSEQNNWRRLEQFLSDPAIGGDDPAEVKRQLARLAQDKGADDKALGFWQGVLKEAKVDEEAEEQLRALYVKVGKWHGLVDLLKDKVKRTDDAEVETKVALIREMIDIYKDHLNAGSKVVGAWNDIRKLQPDNVEALDALAEEYTAMKRWQDLVKVLQAKVEIEQDADAIIALHTQIASIMMERFNNANEAIKSYEAILELDPSNADALTTVKGIYESRRDFDSWVRVSEKELELMPEGEERDQKYVELARTASEKIRKPETPILLWERVLDSRPGDPEALEQLEGLYEREKNYEELVRILDQRTDLIEDNAQKVQALEKLGQTYSSRLDNEDKAAEVWRRVLEIDGTHRKAQAELKKKYTAEGDWENLEWFFRNYATVNDWVRTLESQAKSAATPEDKTTLLFKAAAVWKDELQETRRAVKNLEAVLEIDERHPEAAGMLVPIYREVEQWDRLPYVYEVVKDGTEDSNERQRLLLEVAEVYEQHLGDVNNAFFAYVEAVQERPNDIQLMPELKRLAEASANWESYIEVLQNIVGFIEEPLDEVTVLMELGRGWRDRLQEYEGHLDHALAYFNEVVAIDADNAEALDALETLHRQLGAFDQLIAVLDRKLEIAGSDDETKRLQLGLAWVWRGELGNNAEAEAIYREMMVAFPEATGVHNELIAIYMEEQRHADLRDVLELKRDVLMNVGAHKSVLADLECSLGMLSYGTQPDEDGIRDAVDRFESALGHEDDHDETVRQLETLLGAEAEQLRITRMLEKVYLARSDWQSLADVLEMQLNAAADADDEFEQVALLERLTEIYSMRLENSDLGWRSYGRLFSHQPHRQETRQEFERLTQELDRWDKLVELYTDKAEEPPERDARLAIKLTVARAWHRRIEDLEKAKEFYKKVREEDEENAEATDALEDIYIALDQAEELLDIYRQKVDISQDVSDKIDYLFRTSDLLRDRLARHEDAIGAAQEALDYQPGHMGALQRLDELYTATEDWDSLARTIEDIIEGSLDDQQRVTVMQVRLADVQHAQLGDVQRAVELYSTILEADPENLGTIEALEGLFEDEDHAPMIAPILQPYYDRRGDWPKLVSVYKVREGAEDDPFAKVEWHYKIADLYENQGQLPESAFDHFVAALQLDPGSERTVTELLRLSDSLGNHGELIEHLQGSVEDIDDDMRRKETHRIIANLCRDKTQDMAGCETHLLAILGIADDDAEATDNLIQLYREAADSENLVKMLLQKAQFVQDTTEKQVLYSEAGDLSARVLEDPEGAIKIYEELHNLDPSQDVALTALEQLYEQVEMWEELNDVYRQRIERADDLETKKVYAALRGEVQANKQENLDDAIQTWRQILEWDPEEQQALEKLDGLFSQQEDWYNLLDILQKKQAFTDDDGWAQCQFRIAKLHESDDHLGDIHQGIQAYGALLERVPTHELAIDSLKAIVKSRDERDTAFAVLKPILANRMEFEELWTQYETVATHQADDVVMVTQTLHEMAALAEQQLVDPERAFGAQARAFELDARNTQTVAELERLAETHSMWEQLVGLYSAGAENADDDFLALELRLKTGAILMDRIGDAERAIDVYREVYEDNAEHREVQNRLHSLYEASGMYEELIDVLRNQHETVTENHEKIGYLVKLARISEIQLEDKNAAYEAYMEVLYLDEQSELAITELQRLYNEGVNRIEIAERLEPIYTNREAWEDLHRLLELKLEVLDDAVDQQHIMRQLAQLNLDRIGSKPDAILWFGRAFRIDPEDEGLYEQLKTLAEETDRWDDIKTILMEGAAACEDEMRQVELWGRAAVISRDRLGDVNEAERIFRLQLDVDEENYEALKALDAIYVAAERWDDLEAVLAKEAEVAEYDEERITLLERLAQLYRGIGRREDAIKAYREVLDLNDMHRPTLLALQQMYHEDESWESLYEILEQLVNSTNEDAERAAYTSDMARIAEAYLDKAEDAVNLWEDVLMVSPNNYEAIHELQRLLETQEKFEDLVSAYERELNMGVTDPMRRLELYKRAGRVWTNQLDDALQALGYWEKAREEDGTDRETLEALREGYRENYNFEQLGGVVVAQLQSGNYEVEEQLALWRELAELRTEQLQDASGAIEAWRAVMQLAPGDDDAIENLENLFQQEERWQELAEHYTIKLGYLEDPEERLETWLQAAEIQKTNLGDTAAAAATYHEILRHAPGNIDASQHLETIYEQGQQWQELASLLTDRDGHLEDVEDRLMNLNRLAGIYENQLQQPEAAFVMVQKAVELMPDDPTGLSELYRLAELTEMWDDLVETYDFVLERTDDPESKVEVLTKAGEVQRDKARNGERSAGYFEAILEIDEEREVALRALIELNDALERWEKLNSNLLTLAEVTGDYDEKKTLFARSATVLEANLGDRDRAVQSWEQILDIDEVEKTALDSLQRLHRERADWRALIDIFERVARTDPSREVELKLETASILEEQLEEIDEAITTYEDVLAYDPSNSTALEALEALYGEREDWEKLVDVFERSYDAATSDDDRAEICGKIALIQQEILQDAEAAAQAYQRILYLVPNDEEAMGALEKIYTEGERWEDLVELFEKKIDVSADNDGKVAALSQMAETYRHKVEDLDNAVATYERLLGQSPGNMPALNALDEMYQQQELFEQVVDTLERKLQATNVAEERIELLMRQGNIRRDELMDAMGAVPYYERALTEAPGYDPAVESLVAIHSNDENWQPVVEVLGRKLQTLTTPQQQAIVHVRLAKVLQQKLGQNERALSHYEQAVTGDPENEETLWPLAEHYMAVENWTKASPLLDVLVDKLDALGDRDRLAQVHRQLGLCAEKMFDNDRALDEYRASVELAPPDLDTLRGLSRLTYKKESWEESQRYNQQVLDRYAHELEPEEVSRIHLRLGEASLKTGNIQQAKDSLARVIESQPNNANALEQIVEVLEAHGDWHSAIEYKLKLMDLASEKLEKYTLQLSIGDIYREKLGDIPQATEAYKAALHIGQFSKAPLLQLVGIYSETGDYTRAVNMLNGLIQQEEDTGKKGRYAWMAAIMYRDQIEDFESAVKYLNLVLDYDINKLEAFRAVDELVTKLHDWKLLEQNYRRMIQRVTKAGSSFEKGPALLFMLYKNLGEVYRSRLKRDDYAVSAFELAVKQRPKDEAVREILAELYDKLGQGEKAVEQHRILIRANPQRFESYHTLVNLYRQNKQADEAFCTAGLLVTLGRANDEEEKFYREYVGDGMVETSRSLDDQVWLENIFNEGHDRLLGEVFSILYQIMGKDTQQKSLKELGLKKKDKINIDEATLFASVTRTVSRILGVTPPEIYFSQAITGVQFQPLWPSCMVVGPDMMSNIGEKQLAYHMTKYLTYFHRWHRICTVYPRNQLDLLFMAGAKLADPGYAPQINLPPEQQQVIAQQIGQIWGVMQKNATAQQVGVLQQVMAEFWSKNSAPAIGKWHRSIEMGANHAAMLVTDDMELVGRMIKQEPPGLLSKLSRAEKLKDLVMYGLSPRWSDVRKRMGVQIDYSEVFG